MKKKIIWITLAVLLIAGLIVAWIAYGKIFRSNTNPSIQKEIVLYLPSNGTIQNLYDTLQKKNILKDFSSFKMLAEYKGLDEKYKPGRYIITAGMSNNSMVNMFLSGRQSPIRITFNNVRLREDLAKKLGPKLECGEQALLDVLNDEALAKTYGLNKDNFMVIFIPNTYEVFWTVQPREFVDRMYGEWKKFWTEDRLNKAKEIGLSPAEITVLASIVKGETNKADEMDEVAGVYINRLKKGWKLEADPTVVFGIGDFTITRVTKKHLEFDSPYNTYMYEGLPPGPINLPDVTVLDKVLNYTHHNYMFFCAREDLSGYHNFAVTNSQHEANAAKYRIAYREWARKKKAKEGK